MIIYKAAEDHILWQGIWLGVNEIAMQLHLLNAEPGVVKRKKISVSEPVFYVTSIKC